MHMNDQEYFRSCIAKERQLAQLPGHRHIEECYESAGTLWDNAQALPQWTRDWRACGPPMTEYGVSVTYGAVTGPGGQLFPSMRAVGSAGQAHFHDFVVNGLLVDLGVLGCQMEQYLGRMRLDQPVQQDAGRNHGQAGPWVTCQTQGRTDACQGQGNANDKQAVPDVFLRPLRVHDEPQASCGQTIAEFLV